MTDPGEPTTEDCTCVPGVCDGEDDRPDRVCVYCRDVDSEWPCPKDDDD